MFCSTCGTRVLESSKFCGGCGQPASVEPEPPFCAHEAFEFNLDLTSHKYPGEDIALAGALAVLAFLVIFVAAISATLGLGAVAVALLYLRMRQKALLRDAKRVLPGTCPEVYEALRTACGRLALPVPQAYLLRDPAAGVFTVGLMPPHAIVLSSALVSSLDAHELLLVLARQAGHIKARHAPWLSLTAPLGTALPGFKPLFGFWRRRAEYTADRAGLIGSRDAGAAVRALLKLGGAQRIEAGELMTRLSADRVNVRRLSKSLGVPPETIRRLCALLAFERAHRLTPVADTTGVALYGHCPACGKSIGLHSFAWCTHCGARLPDRSPTAGREATFPMAAASGAPQDAPRRYDRVHESP